MRRALALGTLFAVLLGLGASGQVLSVLHVKITLVDSARGVIPVPRHALLISDNPATSVPRRVLTAPDGTVNVSLRPGSYIVESDEPVTFNGKGYQWTQVVEIAAGRDLVLELTADNAEVGAATVPASPAAPSEIDTALLLPQWKDSVVAVWTPQSRASGFVVDAAGLVVTSQAAIGGALAVEVQLTPSVKVAARVLVSDAARDVAVLWIDPTTTISVRPVPVNCADQPKPALADRQRVVAIGSPLGGQTEISTGEVVRVNRQTSVADFNLAAGGAGGPVFSAGGGVVGLASVVDERDQRRRGDARIVPIDDVCAVVTSARKAMQTAPRPIATRLPVEPLRPVSPVTPVTRDAVAQRGDAKLSSYQVSTSGFDITFLTPVLVSVSQHDTQRGNPRAGSASTRSQEVQRAMQQALTDFGDWSDYFADVPPVLVVRVTPKFAESFWTTIARGAAYTQGVALPAIKHFKPGFARLRAFCGDIEVTPIHPFTLDQRLSETDAIREGLYVFDPQSLGPQCKSVKLLVYSEKEPGKPDTRVVDPQVLERIWQDYRP